MKRYFFILLAIAIIVAANYFYAHNSKLSKLHVVLINHSKRSVLAGTPIFFQTIKVGEVKDVVSIGDTITYENAEFEKRFCIGSATNFVLALDSLSGFLKLEMVNNNTWDPCLVNNDTAFISTDNTSFNPTLQSLMDSIKMLKADATNEEYPDSFKFHWPIDSIRCYCWCMVDKSLDSEILQNDFPCVTTIVPPYVLTRPENYKGTIRSKGKLMEFQDLLSAGRIRRYDLGFDVRLSFVVFTEDRTDTVSFYSHRYLALGNSRIIYYDSDITEDLNAFLNELGINCRGK